MKTNQTDIFEFLSDEADEKIDCTIRISKPIGFQKYKRVVKHFTSKREKEKYLKTLNILIHRKSRYIDNYEIIMLNNDWR